MCCSVLQCVAVCCSIFQCIPVVLNCLYNHSGVVFEALYPICGCVLQRGAVGLNCVATCCRVLQSVAECCSVLQCVAVCCSVLQSVAECCSMVELFAQS